MNVAALGAAFVAGISTSIGPCAAPRYLALLGTLNAGDSWRRVRSVAVFAGGLAASYAVVALVAGALGMMIAYTRLLFVVLAISFCASGLMTIVVRRSCKHDEHRVPVSRGFFSGAASGLVLSPCCTPFVAGTGMLAAASGSSLTAAATLTAFLAGHVAPVLVAGVFGAWAANGIRSAAGADAIATAGATCSLALGLYYGLAA